MKLDGQTQNTERTHDPYEGPYQVEQEQVNDNGTLLIRKGAVLQRYNIRNLHPYKA